MDNLDAFDVVVVLRKRDFAKIFGTVVLANFATYVGISVVAAKMKQNEKDES